MKLCCGECISPLYRLVFSNGDRKSQRGRQFMHIHIPVHHHRSSLFIFHRVFGIVLHSSLFILHLHRSSVFIVHRLPYACIYIYICVSSFITIRRPSFLVHHSSLIVRHSSFIITHLHKHCLGSSLRYPMYPPLWRSCIAALAIAHRRLIAPLRRSDIATRTPS